MRRPLDGRPARADNPLRTGGWKMSGEAATDGEPRPDRPGGRPWRRVIAWWLDYSLLSAGGAVVLWVLGRFSPRLTAVPGWAFTPVYLLMIATTLRATGRTVGHWLVGAARLPDGRYAVEPRLWDHDRWWTLLLGVAAVTRGTGAIAAALSRRPPMPFFGAELGDAAGTLPEFALGVGQVAVGSLALRLRPGVGVAAIGVFGTMLASLFVGRGAWADWYVAARQAVAGRAIPEDQIEVVRVTGFHAEVWSLVLLTAWSLLVASYARRVERGLQGRRGKAASSFEPR